MIALISIKYLQCCGLDLTVGILTSEPKLELDMIVDIKYKGDYDKYLGTQGQILIRFSYLFVSSSFITFVKTKQMMFTLPSGL